MKWFCSFGSSWRIKSPHVVYPLYQGQENAGGKGFAGMIRISVVVCTYNRAEVLAGAIQSLCNQTLEKSLYEIIVVDNHSTDHTKEVVEQFSSYGNVQYCCEQRIGVGYARNTGARNARGTYVAFMDDDARASRDWLNRGLRCFEEVQPSPIAIGGPILPFYNSPKPKWFKDKYEIMTWGEQPRFLKRGESFYGSNMIFRKEVIEAYGGFNVSIGVKGEYLSLGEETALFEKIWQLKDDAAFYYSPQLLVFHTVPPYKMTVSYRLKRAFVVGQVWYLRHRPQSLRQRLRLIIRTFISVAKSSVLALLHRREYSTYQNWIVEKFASVAKELGRLAGCLGLFVPVRQR